MVYIMIMISMCHTTLATYIYCILYVLPPSISSCVASCVVYFYLLHIVSVCVCTALSTYYYMYLPQGVQCYSYRCMQMQIQAM